MENNSKSKIYYICLIAFLLSLTLVVKAIFNWIPVLSGYSIEVYVVVIVFSLMTIPNKGWAWIYLLFVPWFILIVIPIFQNFSDLLLEYIVPFYFFFPFIYFFDLIEIINKKTTNTKKQKIIMFLLFFTLSLISYTLKLMCNVFAGVLWWTPGEWVGAFILNATVIFGSFAICLPVLLGCLYPIYKFNLTNINNNV